MHLRKSNVGSIQFRCKHLSCEKTFADLSALQIHLNLHENNVEKCYFCPWAAVVGQNTHISTHLNQHLKHAIFKCSHCTKKFYRKQSLVNHFEIYHEKIDGKYTCETCGYKTHSSDCLSKHKVRFKHFST